MKLPTRYIRSIKMSEYTTACVKGWLNGLSTDTRDTNLMSIFSIISDSASVFRTLKTYDEIDEEENDIPVTIYQYGYLYLEITQNTVEDIIYTKPIIYQDYENMGSIYYPIIKQKALDFYILGSKIAGYNLIYWSYERKTLKYVAV